MYADLEGETFANHRLIRILHNIHFFNYTLTKERKLYKVAVWSLNVSPWTPW